MEKRVLLVVMPFLPLERPALGVGLLKAELALAGFACDVRYFNHAFADLTGLSVYQRILQSTPTHDLAGEWVFTKALYGERALPDGSFGEYVLRNGDTTYYNGSVVETIASCRAAAPSFISRCADELDLTLYDIIGFSTTFQQNVASLALAQEIKRRSPDTKIVFGGANCEGEMGVELHRRFPFIDFVCSGEADAVFPELVARLRGGKPAADLGGVTYRRGAETVTSETPQRFIERLDELPYPDHSDFVRDFNNSSAASEVVPQLTLETSRGCWWGQKHHCTFCGLNGLSMPYRSKSAERAFREISHLVETYGVTSFFNTDNILDMRYFSDLFPMLIERGLSLQLCYEMKSNLKKEHVLTLKRLGTNWLQPGIESLSTHVLSLMDKGVKGIQNVQLMRWARESGMRMTWNILCGFPGEQPADYERMARTSRAIVHLQPPSSFSQFRLDRFSPMFTSPEKYGLKSVRPYHSYQLCYPFPEESLRRLAYFFEYDSPLTEETLEAIKAAWLVTVDWRGHYEGGSLVAFVSPQFLLIVDTRPNHPQEKYFYTGAVKDIYLAADSARSPLTICAAVSDLHPGLALNEADVRAVLDEFVRRDLMLEEDGLYLRLALIPPEEETFDEEAETERPVPFTQVSAVLN